MTQPRSRLSANGRAKPPFLVQFGSYLWNLLHGNFGNSLTSGRPVWSMVSATAPVSLWLGPCAMIVTAPVAVPLGMVAGGKTRGSTPALRA